MTEHQLVSGSMLLFDRPELLTREDHGHLGLRSLPHPFAFASDVTAVPAMITEFRPLQRYCPVVFTQPETPVPIAVLGFQQTGNLFVDTQGRWSAPGYVPAYLRCYPLALASGRNDVYALLVDRAADMVTEDPETPFFEAGELSGAMAERIELCRSYQADKDRTEAFCQRIAELDLLTGQQATSNVDGNEQTIARYYVVDREKLLALDAETVAGMLQDGSLAAIMAHLFSLDNFSELVRRSAAAKGG